MSKPAVSIIVPNYNHAKFLDKRLESIFSQTFQDFEVLILDDCSTDNSREVIERYSDNSRIVNIIYNQSNSGSTFKQWKKGLEIIQGEWVWIAESDDVADIKFLQTLTDIGFSDKNLNVVHCASNVIDSEGRNSGENTWPQDVGSRSWQVDFRSKGTFEIENYFFYKNIIPNASAAIFRRSALDLSNLNLISTMRFAGDWLFWIHLHQHGDSAFSSQRLNSFRSHSTTTRENKDQKLEHKRIEENIEVIHFVKTKHGASWNWKKHVWFLQLYAQKTSLLERRVISNRNLLPVHYRFIVIAKQIKFALQTVFEKM